MRRFIRKVSAPIEGQAEDQDLTPVFQRKSSDYTVTAADVDAPICVVAVDASGGSVDIDLPSVGDLDDKLVKVFLDTDPGTNNVEVFQSDGTTEVWTGVEQGDFVEVTSDGSNYEVISHYEGHYARVYVSSDEAVAQGASEQITNIAEDTDVGGIWNTTNDEVDIPFDCWVDLLWNALSTGIGDIIPEAKLDTTYISDAAAAVSTTVLSKHSTLACRISATSGQKLELWGRNVDSDSGSQNIGGDAAGDESFATIKLTRRY